LFPFTLQHNISCVEKGSTVCKGQAFQKRLLLLPKVSTRGKLSGRAKSVRVHVGGNRFLVYSVFCYRLPSAALPSFK
jgi:hypothetical protein